MQMIRSLAVALLLVALAIPASAQTTLSLADAIARARRHSTAARGAAAAELEANARVDQARAGYFPRVDVSESWQRGNQPVFAFSSLLAQRRFTAEAFALDALNHPSPVENTRTGLTIEQPLFSPETATSVRQAALARDLAQAERALIDRNLALEVAEAYGAAVAAAAGRRTAAAAAETASANRRLAADRRDAGLTTDADVLQVDVHLAHVRQRAIQTAADEAVARVRLNALMGQPLDAAFVLESFADTGPRPSADLRSLELAAVEHRPDVRRAALNEQLAQAARASARAAFLPEIIAQASWEANGSRLTNQTTSWLVGGVARLNLFRGFGDRARLAESREMIRRRAIEREDAETNARLDVRIALARLDAARARLEAGRAAATEARESHRIIRDRYEAGRADIVSLLRAAETVLLADETSVAAEVDLMVASVSLDRAVGR
jgi:outer membrane protein